MSFTRAPRKSRRRSTRERSAGQQPMFRRLRFESLEDRVLLHHGPISPIIAITHGFQPSGSDQPDWVDSPAGIAADIIKGHPELNCSSASEEAIEACDHFILHNWAEETRSPDILASRATYQAEADKILAQFTALLASRPEEVNINVLFIGHSLGTGVNDLVVEQLAGLRARLGRVDVHALDPTLPRLVNLYPDRHPEIVTEMKVYFQQNYFINVFDLPWSSLRAGVEHAIPDSGQLFDGAGQLLDVVELAQDLIDFLAVVEHPALVDVIDTGLTIIDRVILEFGNRVPGAEVNMDLSKETILPFSLRLYQHGDSDRHDVYFPIDLLLPHVAVTHWYHDHEIWQGFFGLPIPESPATTPGDLPQDEVINSLFPPEAFELALNLSDLERAVRSAMNVFSGPQLVFADNPGAEYFLSLLFPHLRPTTDYKDLSLRPPSQEPVSENGTNDLIAATVSSSQVDELPLPVTDAADGETLGSIARKDAAALASEETTDDADRAGLAPAATRLLQNQNDWADVNADGRLTPQDAFLIIGPLRSAASGARQPATVGLATPLYLDVNGDGQLTRFDALLVISELRLPSSVGRTVVGQSQDAAVSQAAGAEGEAVEGESAASPTAASSPAARSPNNSMAEFVIPPVAAPQLSTALGSRDADVDDTGPPACHAKMVDLVMEGITAAHRAEFLSGTSNNHELKVESLERLLPEVDASVTRAWLDQFGA